MASSEYTLPVFIKVLKDQTPQGAQERKLILTLRNSFSLRWLQCVWECVEGRGGGVE